ncbi:MAG: trehalose-phosphatase [Coriobacteriia bacterium]|nr:trehalose-phosphatase [Coriobacteriia bacterium]
MGRNPLVSIDPDRYDAVIFDMDGVITDTADLHAEAWKLLFDDVLREHAETTGEPFEPFDIDHDYLRYVDGKARYDGVRSFLASRGIELPEGSDDDPPSAATVHGLGTRKNDYFLAAIDRGGVEAFPAAVELVRGLREAGVATAIISASRNAAGVLAAAGVDGLFDARVDGDTAAELGLPGKPDPAVFLEAARRLDAEPARAVVVEDAESGVEAGEAGGFGLVIGVDRTGRPERLLESGADVVVNDLTQVKVARRVAMNSLPSALDNWRDAEEALDGREPAVFLDYDGTLTPIVERPEDALLAPEMRERIRHLADRCLVVVVSGRDVGFVVEQVALDTVLYLGSHGFDVVVPEGRELRQERLGEFEAFLGPLEAAEAEITAAVAAVAGARIERKKYAIAVHYRQVAEEDIPEVEVAVDEVLARHGELRKTGGKKVFELRPDIDWDKGRALLWVLEALGMDGDGYAPVYVGDDLTDEDAFAVVRGRGLAVVVGSEDRPTLAEFHVPDTDAAGEVLERLAAFIGGERR